MRSLDIEFFRFRSHARKYSLTLKKFW